MNSTPEQPGQEPDPERPAAPPPPQPQGPTQQQPPPPQPPQPPYLPPGATVPPGSVPPPGAAPGMPQPGYQQAPSPDAPRQLGGLSFGKWVLIGVLGGLVLSIGWFFIGINLSIYGIFEYSWIAWMLTLVAGIVLLFWQKTRGLATGLLISVAGTPVVLFGVCLVMISTVAL